MDLAILNRLEAEGKMPEVADVLAQIVRMIDVPASSPLDAFALVSVAQGLVQPVSGQNQLHLLVNALLTRAIDALEQVTSTPNEHFLGLTQTAH